MRQGCRNTKAPEIADADQTFMKEILQQESRTLQLRLLIM